MIYKYSLTDKGISKEIDGKRMGSAGICTITGPDGIEYLKLLDRPYITKDSIAVWSEKDLTRCEAVIRFRKILTTHYIRVKKELIRYGRTYLHTLSSVPFNTDLPFKTVPVEKYISSGVARYLAMLDRELFRWYERNKRNLFKKGRK